eukprot:8416931-Pyramimonas_sp.AAC.1
MNFSFFEKCFQKLSLSTPSTLTREMSSTRFPAVTRVTVHRRRQFRRAGELVAGKISTDLLMTFGRLEILLSKFNISFEL